jgi:hypothetical protein
MRDEKGGDIALVVGIGNRGHGGNVEVRIGPNLSDVFIIVYKFVII